MKLIFVLINLIITTLSVQAQSLNDILLNCTKQILDSEQIFLEIDITASDGENGKILERSNAVFYKDNRQYFSSIEGLESFYISDLDLAFVISHEEKIANIYPVDLKKENAIESLTKLFDFVRDEQSEIRIKQERFAAFDLFQIYLEDQLVMTYKIDLNESRVEEVISYQNKKYSIENQEVEPVIRMIYKYKNEQPESNFEGYFLLVNDQWVLKETIKHYKMYDYQNRTL